MNIHEILSKGQEVKSDDLSTYLTQQRPIVIFGSGNLGRRMGGFLIKHDMPLIAFADNNDQKWGSLLLERTVSSPASFDTDVKEEAIWIVAIWSPGNSFVQVKDQLEGLGVKKVFHAAALMQLYPNELLPYYHFQTPAYFLDHRDAISKVYECLADHESRQQFLAHLNCRVNLDFEGLPVADSKNQYFPGDIIELTDKEVFLDAGAYNGDTLEEFMQRTNGQFEKYIALEPDPDNYEALKAVTAVYPPGKIALFQYAIGEENGMVRFDATGGANAHIMHSGTYEVPCKRIDDFLFDSHPSFMKFDIEGAELDALNGAENTIRAHKPTLAVCIYHKPDDLWSICLYLKNNFPFYSFFVRTHQWDGLDFVLYAISKSK